VFRKGCSANLKDKTGAAMYPAHVSPARCCTALKLPCAACRWMRWPRLRCMQLGGQMQPLACLQPTGHPHPCHSRCVFWGWFYYELIGFSQRARAKKPKKPKTLKTLKTTLCKKRTCAPVAPGGQQCAQAGPRLAAPREQPADAGACRAPELSEQMCECCCALDFQCF
jgi:hypothetical protein